MLEIPRRDFIAHSGAALAILYASRLAYAFPTRPGEEVMPWLDQPPENPVPDAVKNQLRWEDLTSWITPNEKFFGIAHSKAERARMAAMWTHPHKHGCVHARPSP